jgi:hypothetical protein
MMITPKQIATLLFHVSNLRYFEKEYTEDKEKDPKLERAIVKLRWEIDQILNEMGLDDHFTKETLSEIIKINLETSKKAA